MTTRILLLEDHTLVRSGIRSLLERSSEMRVVGECGDGRTALQLCGELAPDIVLADVEMRDLNGIETAADSRPARADQGHHAVDARRSPVRAGSSVAPVPRAMC